MEVNYQNVTTWIQKEILKANKTVTKKQMLAIVKEALNIYKSQIMSCEDKNTAIRIMES